MRAYPAASIGATMHDTWCHAGPILPIGWPTSTGPRQAGQVEFPRARITRVARKDGDGPGAGRQSWKVRARVVAPPALDSAGPLIASLLSFAPGGGDFDAI